MGKYLFTREVEEHFIIKADSETEARGIYNLMTNFKDPFCVLPLRDIVVFPNMIVPLFVGRAKSIKALDFAEKHDKEILL